MKKITWAAAAAAMAWLLVACSSGDGGGAPMPAPDGGATNGAVTFSCMIATSICTQILVPESEISQEHDQCVGVERGTPGAGCPPANVVGCCKKGGAAEEEQCAYDEGDAQVLQGLCAHMSGVWSTTP